MSHSSDAGPTLPTRSTTDRMLVGVCGGLAAHFRLDPVIVRLAFVLLALLGAGGMLAYVALALFLRPDDATELSPQGTVRRGIDDASERLRKGLDGLGARGEPRRVLGIVIVGVGAFWLLRNLGALAWFGGGWGWPLVLVALGAWLLLRGRSSEAA